jgi:hypothetical protein
MRTGRPPKYETPEEMQAVIDRYFESTNKPTVTGLALYLGFEDRHSLLYYETDKPEFLTTIKKAKSKIAQYLEEQLYRQSTVTGIIFSLKNNFGWKDQQEYTHLTEENGESKPIGFVWPTG